ncbi:MAG TPA: hypothetical protein VIV11_04185 [Kofleriaceae bacterium]
MIARIVLVLVVMASSAMAGGAADLVRQAKESLHELRYEEALVLADRAWRTGQADAGELHTIFAVSGQAAGAMNRGEDAQLWFTRWLSLDPQAQLPVGTSPKLTALLDKARSALAGSSLDARAERGADATSLTIASDPASLVAAARADSNRVELVAGKASLPKTTRVIDLVDRYGNVIVSLPIGEQPAVPITLPPGERTEKPSLFARWPTWAIVAAGFAAVGGGALWVAVDARSEIRELIADSPSHQFADTIGPQRRFERAQLTAQLAFGASAAAALIAVVVGVRGDRVVVTPASGGGAVSWLQRF